ncbi:MAG: cytochrome P450 [Streptosporangiaceae bacterium]|jgi:cytochrome P450
MTVSDVRSEPPGVAVVNAANRVMGRLMSPAGLADPYPHLHALRTLAPVYRSGNVYFVTTYADCRQVVNNPDFAVQDPAWYDLNMPRWRENTATRLMYLSMQSRNNPDHNRLRRLAGGAFSPRRMDAYRALIERVAPPLFDRMADAGADGSPVDLMEYLAYPLPTVVMGEMLGVPEDDRERFRGLGADFFNVMELYPEEGAVERAHAAAAVMLEYWTGIVAERRAEPRDDLTTELIRACDQGLLSEEELLGLVMFLFSAGYRTTAALIGNVIEQLLAFPEEADRFRRGEYTPEAVVEESLRHEAPSQLVPRQTTADVVLGGVEIPARQLLVCLVGAANRDPDVFTEPDRFWPGRPEGRVLSFGGGLHFCVGAALSRMETAVLLPMLFERFPALAPGGTPERRQALRMRMHTRLPVSLRG